MRNILIILGKLFFSAMIVVPIIFKPQLVKLEANKDINATLDFGSVGLKLFGNFPNVTLNFNLHDIKNLLPPEKDVDFLSGLVTTDLFIEVFQNFLTVQTLLTGDICYVFLSERIIGAKDLWACVLPACCLQRKTA